MLSINSTITQILTTRLFSTTNIEGKMEVETEIKTTTEVTGIINKIIIKVTEREIMR